MPKYKLEKEIIDKKYFFFLFFFKKIKEEIS